MTWGTENSYGRGSEIWPPTNTDRSVKLNDSFPNGMIPYKAMEMILEQEKLVSKVQGTNNNKNKNGQEKDDNQPPDRKRPTTTTTSSTTTSSWVDRIPGLMALGLLGRIRPVADVGLVVVLSAYTALLTLAAQSGRVSDQDLWEYDDTNDDDTDMRSTRWVPTLPSLPPQGHVPQLVQNPMRDLSYSLEYDLWWRLGIGLGFVLPVLSLIITSASTLLASPFSWLPFVGTTTTAAVTAATTITTTTLARPLFLLCCQALTEVLCKDWLVPLPIRIWIPISYQMIRIPYLAMGWVSLFPTLSSVSWTMGHWVGLLTGLNLVYTAVNVFGFLIPVALMRYLRAHFFAVEAASVTVHRGLEETIGVPPASSS